MMKNNIKYILILIASLLLASCNQEQFGVGKQTSTISTAPVVEGKSFSCADHTLIRPPVDLLFLWDNSGSTNQIHPQKKQALNNTLNYISDRFDYQVMIAPLVINPGDSLNKDSLYFSRSGQVRSGVRNIYKENAVDELSTMALAGSSAEAGSKRARDLIRNNMSNNIFRPNAYTIVVLLSNQDDNSYVHNDFGSNLQEGKNLADGATHDLLCLKGGSYNGSFWNSYSDYSKNCSGVPKLNSSMMRFLTISYNSNIVYRRISSNISTNGNYGSSDFTNLSSSSFTNIFDQVNSVIADQVVKHRYNFWPVAGSNVEIDTSTIQVQRDNGSVLDPSHFNYHGIQSNKNTRYFPSPGEPYTGHMIELIGAGEVIFPSCLKVTYKAPRAYYGYCHIPSQPLESSIVVKINGSVVDQSKWTLLKSGNSPRHFANKNIRITSPTNFSPRTPAENKSGYFVQLDPSVVYTNNQTCQVSYYSTGQIN